MIVLFFAKPTKSTMGIKGENTILVPLVKQKMQL